MLVLVVAGVGRFGGVDDDVDKKPGLPPSRTLPMLLLPTMLPDPGCVEPRDVEIADVAPVATLPVLPEGADEVEGAPIPDAVPVPNKEAVNRG